MPILSVIVPIYNIESYLREGLESILNQDVKDIEVICVNDCSTDHSAKIAQEYCNKDKRITLYNHLSNKGLSSTRNTGLEFAKGEYIAFFDPDDQVEKNMYAEMINIMQQEKTDMVMCGFQTIPDGNITIPHFRSDVSLSPYEFLKGNTKIHSNNDLCFSWRFLFKRSFLVINKLKFIEEIRIMEDMVFNFSCLMKAKRVYLLPKTLYKYRTNNTESIMKKQYSPYLERCLQMQIQEKKNIIRQYHIDHYIPITQDLSEDIVKRYTRMLFNNLKHNPHEPDKLQGIKRILSMPMIREAMKVVGYHNIYTSWKEYIFYLAMKFKCARLVKRLYFK